MMNDTRIIGCTRAVTLTPSDTQNISDTTANAPNGSIPHARKLRALTAGTVKVTTLGGDVTSYTLTAGQIMDWVEVVRVWATGTSATIEALY